jgi:hypothetical protein
MEKLEFEGEDFKAVPLTPDVLARLSHGERKWPELFRDPLATVPVIEREGRAFAVRLADIPEPHRLCDSITGTAGFRPGGRGHVRVCLRF